MFAKWREYLSFPAFPVPRRRSSEPELNSPIFEACSDDEWIIVSAKDVKANICAGLETLKVEGEGRARLEEGGFRSSSNENLVGEKTATNGRSGGEALGERSKKEAVNTTKVAKVKKRQQVEARLQQRKQLEDLLFENNNHNNRPLHDNNSNNNNNNNNRTNDNFPNNHYKHYYKESRNQLRRRQKQLGIENKRRRRRDMSC